MFYVGNAFAAMGSQSYFLKCRADGEGHILSGNLAPGK